jgi:hypothetical protein
MKHLPNLKSSNIKYKKLSHDLLANIKILSFISLSEFKYFYKKITDKYKNKFENFFKYFERNYINSNKYGELSFNYIH